jgi:hypothetical protein
MGEDEAHSILMLLVRKSAYIRAQIFKEFEFHYSNQPLGRKIPELFVSKKVLCSLMVIGFSDPNVQIQADTKKIVESASKTLTPKDLVCVLTILQAFFNEENHNLLHSVLEICKSELTDEKKIIFWCKGLFHRNRSYIIFFKIDF